MSIRFYILDEKHRPVETLDTDIFRQWHDDEKNWIIGTEYIGPARVTTAFYSASVQFCCRVYYPGHWLNGHECKYSTWEIAEEGHKNVIEWVQKALKMDDIEITGKFEKLGKAYFKHGYEGTIIRHPEEPQSNPFYEKGTPLS